MKKLLFILIFASIPVFAATTGILELSGIIPEILEIIVDQTTTSVNLEIEETIELGTVKEISNSNTGYKIALTSLNLGHMVLIGGIDAIPYDLYYDGIQADLSVSGGIAKTATNLGEYTSAVVIHHAAQISRLMVSGEYRDQITIEIQRN